MNQNDTNTYRGPLFIVGMPRSGTKLLRSLLNQHPRVCILEIETEILPWLARHVGEYGDLSDPGNFKRLYDQVTKFPFFLYRTDEGKVIDATKWHSACANYEVHGIFEALVRIDTGTKCDTDVIWGDKSPSYINNISLISSLFPQAKIIHIVRDVRDFCLSIHQAWGKDMLRAAQRWVDGISAAKNAGAGLGDRFLEIRYEDLLTDTAKVMNMICRFLGIDFVLAMTTLVKPSENIGSAKGLTVVMKENTGKYAILLPGNKLLRIEQIAGQLLQQYGYELVHPLQTTQRLSKTEMLIRQFKDGVSLVRDESRQRGLIGALRFHLRYFQTTRG